MVINMSQLIVNKIVVGMCQTNCYFVYREGSKDLVFVDPADYGEKIYETIVQNGFNLKAILITHGHFDHIMGTKELKAKTGVPVYAPNSDKVLLDDPYVNVSAQWAKAYTMEADVYFNDGDLLELTDDIKCKVIETSGHTIGSSCFYFEEDGVLISGDTLFECSVGRTDLPTGSMSKLVHSIKEKLFVLPDDVVVYPGHGSATSIGFEKENNPCV